MIRLPPRSTRTVTLFAYTTLVRSCQLLDQASTSLVAERLLVEALGQPGYASCVLAVAIDHCDNLGNVWIDRPAGERRYAIGQGPDVDHPAPAVVNQLTWVRYAAPGHHPAWVGYIHRLFNDRSR